jgi:two-component system cell cycle response regulator
MKILIIDDNAHHAELAACRLEQEGWKIEISDDPIPRESFHHFDFIILDFSMPRASGIDVLKKMKEMEIRTPVILMTGHGNEIIASDAIKLGAYDYLVKDTQLVYLERLPNVIREARSKHELLETNRFLIQELQKANDQLQKLTFTDEMTDIYNYRFLMNQLGTEISRVERYKKPLCLCLIDIDFFKQINDRYGHPTGDATLRKIANILKETTRAVDFVGRYAGDEFLIIFPDTHLEDAKRLCERIRQKVSDEKFYVKNQLVRLSLSIGLTSYSAAERKTSDSMIEAADMALYKAKEKGRNRVEVFQTGLAGQSKRKPSSLPSLNAH